MKRNFDLVAIGTGAAATTAAMKCCDAGWQVAIVDSRPFGGTCALRGCDPKKVLVGASDVFDWARRMSGYGVDSEKLRIDWSDLMRFKRTFTEPVPKQHEAMFAKAGIAAFHGRARFTGPTSVQVGDDTLEGRYVVIAAGRKPADLKIPGVQHLTTSEQFLELDALPARILFIGGGYIAFEFAHVAVRAGAGVTIVHRGARPLEVFDEELVEQVVKRTRELGVAVQIGTKAEGVAKSPRGLAVETSSAEGRRAFEADMVVHAAGRVPELDDLNLAAAEVKWTERGVTVNRFLQSVSNPAVYAAGDAAANGGPPLTPVAGYEGSIVASNLLHGNHQEPDHRGIPTVVYTIPPLASVGLGEREAQSQGLKCRVKRGLTSDWYSSRRVRETYSGFKTLVEEGTDRIVGAHVLGGQAEEVINLFAIAMRHGIRAGDLKHGIFAYPSHGSDVPYML